jgi:hypothetical protein
MGKGFYSSVSRHDVESSNNEYHEKCCKISCFSTKCFLCTFVIFCFLIVVTGLVYVHLTSDHSKTNSLTSRTTDNITTKTYLRNVSLSKDEEIRLKEGVINWIKGIKSLMIIAKTQIFRSCRSRYDHSDLQCKIIFRK